VSFSNAVFRGGRRDGRGSLRSRHHNQSLRRDRVVRFRLGDEVLSDFGLELSLMAPHHPHEKSAARLSPAAYASGMQNKQSTVDDHGLPSISLRIGGQPVLLWPIWVRQAG